MGNHNIRRATARVAPTENIVPLTEEHIDGICEIENESFGDPWNRQMFLDLFDSPLSVCYTAVDTLEITGYLIAYHVGSEIQILNIAVKKSKRHRKIATGLFGVIFEYAKAENAAEFTLEVRPTNGGAIALYNKLGFKIDGVRKNYYRNPKEDAVLMSLRLE